MMICRIAACVGLFCLVGCNGGPAVSPVTGKVTLDGTPLVGAVVSFSPVTGGTGKAAVGTTDASGTYTVTDTTSKNIGGGAVVGEYKVGVVWFKPDPNDTSRSTGSSDKSMNSDKSAATAVTGPKAALPTAYQNPETSGLTLTVKSGSNPFDIVLDSKFAGK